MVRLRQLLSKIDPTLVALGLILGTLLLAVYCDGQHEAYVSVLETKQEETREAAKEATKEYVHATKEISRDVRSGDAHALHDRILRSTREILAQEASALPVD